MTTPYAYINTKAAKQEFSRVVNQVFYGKQPVIVTSRGKPKVAIVNLDVLEQRIVTSLEPQARTQNRLQLLQKADRLREHIKKRAGKSLTDPVVMLHEARQERDAQIQHNLR